MQGERPSREYFRALLRSKIWEKYDELQKRFKELKRGVGKAKIRNKEIKEEIDAHLVLLERSIKETREGMKKFTNSFERSIKELHTRTISEDTTKHLQKFVEEHLPYLPPSTEIDNIVEEMLNVAEMRLKKKGSE